MYPRDTISTYYQNTANGTFTVLGTSTRTILDTTIINTLGKGTQINLQCGTTTILKNHNNDIFSLPLNYVCTNQPIRVTVTGHDNGGEDISISYVNRDRTVTPDVTRDYSTTTNVIVSNFPTGFNIHNFPELQVVAVNNFPTLQDVRCTIGCDASTTLILSSSTIQVLTTTAPTFQEWMLVVGVFLAINSIHVWNFLFGKPRLLKK